MNAAVIDMTDEKISYLTAKEYVGNSKWLCLCDCGNVTIVRRIELKYAKEGTAGKGVHSCGCMRGKLLSKANSTKRRNNTKLYKVYDSMKQRCLNHNNHAFKDYGGRGIKVCKEWLNSYESFYYWAIQNGYKDELTIDRINVNGNYEPSNCRWVGWDVQYTNKRNTIRVEVKGEFLTIPEISKKYLLSDTAVYYRYYQGYRGDELIRPSGFYKHNVKEQLRNK
ncbi:hypothetical protein [Virgibacillus sp. CBA3643]|uniref:hypothetical protein n=1 Tax=Virgibacillus sp. CBA3643 TaxID=2942278 RepID=UPI0035A2D4D8